MVLVGTGGNDAKNAFEGFLRDYGIWIAVAVAMLILIVVLIFIIKNKKPKKVQIDHSNSSDELIESLGGKDNITDVKGVGSRLTIGLNNSQLIKREELEQYGVKNIVQMSGKVILVIENEASKIAEKMKNILQI